MFIQRTRHFMKIEFSRDTQKLLHRLYLYQSHVLLPLLCNCLLHSKIVPGLKILKMCKMCESNYTSRLTTRSFTCVIHLYMILIPWTFFKHAECLSAIKVRKEALKVNTMINYHEKCLTAMQENNFLASRNQIELKNKF